MRSTRLRFSIRRLMAAVALSGVVLAWAVDRSRRGDPLVVLEYPDWIEDEPLINPTLVRTSEAGCLVLADGRAIRIEGWLLASGLITLEDLTRGRLIDLATRADGTVAVHALRPAWYCGNSSRRNGLLPIRLPLFARPMYRNHRAFVGTGQFVKRAAPHFRAAGLVTAG